jgi:putative FmdB family regulatory protein
MPIYEYVCEKCGHHLEILQKMSDKPLTKCPNCKGKLEKIFSQTSFQLKGSGWYATDYTSKGQVSRGEKSEKTEKGEKGEKKDAAPTCATGGGVSASGNCDN